MKNRKKRQANIYMKLPTTKAETIKHNLKNGKKPKHENIINKNDNVGKTQKQEQKERIKKGATQLF